MPRSFHIRANSSMRSSAAAGIAPSEWLMRYVVSRRIGNRSRYSVSSMPRSLVPTRGVPKGNGLVSDTMPSDASRCDETRSDAQFEPMSRGPPKTRPGVRHGDGGVTEFPQSAGLGASAVAEVALGRADVTRRRTEEAARLLLLENVRRPARDARAREHRGRERRWDLGDVEDDCRVVLDVRGEDAIRGTLLSAASAASSSCSATSTYGEPSSCAVFLRMRERGSSAR